MPFEPRRCPFPSCPKPHKVFKSQAGLTQHVNALHLQISQSTAAPPPTPPLHLHTQRAHGPQHVSVMDVDVDGANIQDRQRSRSPSPNPGVSRHPREQTNLHPFLTGTLLASTFMYMVPVIMFIPCFFLAIPLDQNGRPIDPGMPPPPRTTPPAGNWTSFEDELQFKTADFLYRRVEMSAPNIDYLMELWAFSKLKDGEFGPFEGSKDMYAAINAIPLGSVPWECFVNDPVNPSPDAPSWQTGEHQIWFRDPERIASLMLDNPDFNGQFDTTPYVRIDRNGGRRLRDVMSGNYAYRHAVRPQIPLLMMLSYGLGRL